MWQNFAWSKAGSRVAVVGRLQSATTVTTRVKDANDGTITTSMTALSWLLPRWLLRSWLRGCVLRFD
jgi:hypothetical protein